jgi:hypothetical protein
MGPADVITLTPYSFANRVNRPAKQERVGHDWRTKLDEILIDRQYGLAETIACMKSRVRMSMRVLLWAFAVLAGLGVLTVWVGEFLWEAHVDSSWHQAR